VSGYVAVATRVLAAAEVAGDADPGDVSNQPEAGSAQIELPGRDGTLLAVVPVPGTGTSLVIVGYAVATPDARPAPDQGGETGLVIDRMQRRVWVGGREVVLTFQEFELLAFLSGHPGMVFSRAELGAMAWQGAWRADSRTVDVHVSRLRRKLGPAYGRCLATEYRVGYRFQAPGTVTADPGALACGQAAHPGGAITTGRAGSGEDPPA
jgi:DNA-binding winged helix-turn-helix (wHTH) protein